MNGYYDQVTRLLKKAGFSFAKNGKGSHEIYTRGSYSTTVPFNLVSRHLANQILKDAGIKHKF